MKNASGYLLALSLCAGGAVGVEETPTTVSPSHGRVVQAAHIYFNIATGERVVTVLGDGQTASADNGTSGPVWSSLVGNLCADQGFTTSFFFIVDNNAGTTTQATGITVVDWGDIELDTVVDCVHIEWVTGHNDTDSDFDSIGDGVAGLAGEWTYWDRENGRDFCTRFPLISFRFIDLPGNIFGDGFITGYTADIDLAGSFTGTSLTFEIGDSDGDLQGAAFGHDMVEDPNNPGVFAPIATLDLDFDGQPDSDIDGDGLFDWAWSVQFFQPGTADHDGDGVNDGDLGDGFRPIGINIASPEGTAIDHGDGTWTWEIDTSPFDAGTGAEDLYAVYDGFQYLGLQWFGGFECSSEPLPDGPGYTPRADFAAQLFGPGAPGPCFPDFNGDGVLNFFDISYFLMQFGDPDTCDYNGDGSCNFFDISAFLQDFLAGCG